MVCNKGGSIKNNLGKMIEVKNLKRYYKSGEDTIKAIDGVSFVVENKEFVALVGASGSGKTTLLRILGLIDKPTDGQYSINGLNVKDLQENERTYYRLTQLGYVFQDYALINEMTALENIYVLSVMDGMSKLEAKKLAMEALKKVGLAEKYNRVPNELSGGEKQRVAIARAISKNPQILFADEPCANLDTANSQQILEVFVDLNKKYNQTIIMVTHEPWHVKYTNRIIKLKDGHIESDTKKK